MVQRLEPADKDIKIMIAEGKIARVKQRLGRYKKDSKLLERKTTMSEIKNTLDGINSKLDIAEEKISLNEDIEIEIIQNKTQREKGLKIQSISEVCVNFQEVHINVIGLSKEEMWGERKKTIISRKR